MAPKRVTLPDLVEGRRFDESNWRHRRALDESEPLDDPELEEARQLVLELRGLSGTKIRAAEELRRFAELVARG
jgi:hypothetical protein